MSLVISPEQQQVVSELLASGLYSDGMSVVDEALMLLRERDHLRSLLKTGGDQLDAGERIPAAEVMSNLRRTLSSSH